MWDDARVALLRKLWAEGLSASQCAKQIGGVTRSAVCGKARRLNLESRVLPPPSPPATPIAYAAERPTPRVVRPPAHRREPAPRPVKPKHKFTADPASQIAAALLAQAAAAQRRRDQFRTGRSL